VPQSRRSSRRTVLRIAACVPLLALPGLVPAAASADFAAANTWAGGTAGAARSADLGGRYAARGALVSVATGGTKARLYVSVRSERCVANGTLRGTVVPQPGGVGELQTLQVRAAKTLTTSGTYGRTRARVSVTLSPGAPGLLVGTVEARGRVTLRGRTRACTMRETVSVRSRAALAAPAAPSSVAPGATRTGILESAIAPRARGAIALTGRRDGYVHGFWVAHQSCRSGTKRSAEDVVNIIRRFRVRANGTFRDREVATTTLGTGKNRSRLRFVATISGRIGADGVARGRIEVRSRSTLKGYVDLVCTTPSTPFTAAPAA